MGRSYIYVIDRDYGFAPNPFHGCCTLATCKPVLREAAQLGDWVIGVGGSSLGARGRCIYGMEVTQQLTYDQYWNDATYAAKKPARNGSKTMLVGDNIYHLDPTTDEWRQADSHHSNSDGSVNPRTVTQDTKSDCVLLSRRFFYFGSSAPTIPPRLLDDLGYRNGRHYRVFQDDQSRALIDWIRGSGQPNRVMAVPFQFHFGHRRFDGLRVR